jgi:hypothetical protein
MKINYVETIPGGIQLAVVETEDRMLQQSFDKRFQVLVEVDKKRGVPVAKRKLLSVRVSEEVHHMVADDGTRLFVPTEAYLEKQLCDRSLEDCNIEILGYLSMYNEGKDLKKIINRAFKF